MRRPGPSKSRKEAPSIIVPGFSSLSSSSPLAGHLRSISAFTNHAAEYLICFITPRQEPHRSCVSHPPFVLDTAPLLALAPPPPPRAALIADGAATIANGALIVADGAATVADGAPNVADGAATVADGAATVADGAATVADGAATVADGAAGVTSNFWRGNVRRPSVATGTANTIARRSSPMRVARRMCRAVSTNELSAHRSRIRRDRCEVPLAVLSMKL